MNYAASVALQTAIYDALMNDAALTAQLSGQIFDAPPTGDLPQIYALIGDERVLDRSSKTSSAAIHEFRVLVIATESGFTNAKHAASEIAKVLQTTPLNLSHGILVDLSLRSVRATRGNIANRRQIDLTFRAYIDAV
ncbi:hypothetical protein BFP76_07370 [Amylibacter kogurei]|uniref:DUF3168 domain-containing protein n=1 Tax=Paramylibacter kogurei TaxID=1889778 RepID=A0A2G5K6B2_9RHOB|nr:DUF3168 domain-containing protein [Amylibacter kogurei]PIB24965.1 hypothetical protein BFP76_07370 [Amylibacter kogurei]